jgi:hypothetical protein
MRYLFVATAAVSLALLMISSCNQDRGAQQNSNRGAEQQTFADAQTAATQSLTTFRQLVTKDNYQQLGFESPDEVSGATLGQPIQVFMVKLDQLREYKAGTDPNALLTNVNQMQYPVMVRDQVRSAIAVGQADGKWKATSFGNAGLARQVAQARKADASSTTPDAASQSTLVHVAALGLYFVANRNADGKLIMTPLADNPAFNLRAGASMPAEQVFTLLSPFAQKYNGLPM